MPLGLPPVRCAGADADSGGLSGIDRSAGIGGSREVDEGAGGEADLGDAREEAAPGNGRPALGALDAADAQARAAERRGIGPDRVDVLVDPELLLTGLVGVVRVPEDAANAL